MTGAKLDPKNALNFMMAGKATVTLRSVRTGVRFTYRINQPNPQSPHFVRLLTGPENTRNYSYMGRITNGQYIHDRRNRAGREDSPAAKGFRAVLYKLAARDYSWVEANVEIWHAGKCGRCGRLLTVPESIETGIGPVCSGMSRPAARNANVIRNAKPIQTKAADCVVTESHLQDTFNVKSPSGETYSVTVREGNAYCGCEWGSYRPGSDKRCGCSHGQAALNYVEQKNGRKLSVWTDETDAKRQHRPTRHVGDGTIVTSRLVTPEMEREAEFDAEFARMEIAQDQAAEEAKMAMEMGMVARLQARAG